MRIDVPSRSVRLDPCDPAFFNDPYPYYHEIRSQVPVFRWEEYGHWCFARYEDVNALLRDLLQRAKAHKLALFFIPQVQPQRLKARPERDGGHIHELGVLLHTALERVVRDARAEVMNMVKADIAGEPLEHLGQLEIRAAAQRGGGVVPFFVLGPVGAFELVLDVEHPDAT